MQIKQARKEPAKREHDTGTELKLITFDTIRSSARISGCVHSGLARMNGEAKRKLKLSPRGAFAKSGLCALPELPLSFAQGGRGGEERGTQLTTCQG